MKKIFKFKINWQILNSVKKLGILSLGLMIISSLNQIQGTNSYFNDSVTISDNTFSAGYWVPPETPEVLGWNVRSQSSHYSELPVDIACGGITNGDFPEYGNGQIAFLWEGSEYYGFTVKYEKQWLRPGKSLIESNWEGHEIWNQPYTNYRTFSSSVGTEGLWHNRVRAFVDTNGDGQADLYSGWSEPCAVVYDRTAPRVKVENIDDGDSLFGVVDIFGTIKDANPHHYWLVIQDSKGKTIAGPGVVNDENEINNEKLFTWDTTNFENGEYIIKLEARDAAGNKDADSFDWVEVEVANYTAEEAIVINEFVPNPVGDDRDFMPNGEWVELYNKSNTDFDVDGWYLYDADNSGIEISDENSDNDKDTGDSGETIVPAGGFLVVYRNNDGSFELNNEGDEEIKLYNGKISESGVLVDSHEYNGSEVDMVLATLLGTNSGVYDGDGKSDVPIGKSFVRYPDGANNWIDPIPTPGKANKKDGDYRELIEYYKEVCYEDNEPVCDLEFMEAIGIFRENPEEEPDLVSDFNNDSDLNTEEVEDKNDEVDEDKVAEEPEEDSEEEEEIEDNKEESNDEEEQASIEEDSLEEDATETESEETEETESEASETEEESENDNADEPGETEDEVDQKQQAPTSQPPIETEDSGSEIEDEEIAEPEQKEEAVLEENEEDEPKDDEEDEKAKKEEDEEIEVELEE